MQPFNPFVGLLTLIREVRKWASLEIENEGDLLEVVLETPSDLERLRFKWSEVGFDMGHDGVIGPVSETGLNTYMEALTSSLPNLAKLTLTMFPSPLEFHTLDGLISSPAGKHLATKIKELKILASHPSHLNKIAELLGNMKNLDILVLEHLQLPNPHAHHLVVK